MNWRTLKERLGLGGPGRPAPFVLPSVALEFQPDFVAGATLDRSSRQVRRLVVRELEPGSLGPFPNRPNLTNEAVVRHAITEVAEAVGNGSGRLGVLLPDASMRVAVLRFETLPDDRREAEALVRWKMREILPFAPEEARVSYQVGWREAEAVELWALAVRNSVLAEYESALEAVNEGPSLILPATAALLPLLPEDADGSQLLIHVCSGSVTTVAVSSNRVRYWRNRLLPRVAPQELAKAVSPEAARMLATCRDHLQIEIGQVWVCARPPATPDLVQELAQGLGREALPVAGDAEVAATLPPAEHELLGRFGMTFAGLLANLD